MKSYKKFLLSTLASTAILSLGLANNDVQAAEASPSSVASSQATTETVAKVVNEEALKAEQEAYKDNNSPAGIQIGIKEWSNEYDKEGNLKPLTDPSAASQAWGDTKYSYRQTKDGGYEVQIGSEKEPGSQWIAASTEKPAVAPIYESKEPSRIINQIASDPKTATNLSWYTRTAEPVQGSVVKVSTNKDMSDARTFIPRVYKTYSSYLEKDANGNIIFKYSIDGDWDNGKFLYSTDADIKETNYGYTGGDEGSDVDRGAAITQDIAETIYHADVTGLKPNTKYYYTVGAPGYESKQGQFTTAKKENAPFEFIHYTDSQNAYWTENIQNEPMYTKDTVDKARQKAPNADFVINTGDFIEIAQVEDEWVDLINQTQETFLQLPHAMVSGNHDEKSIYGEDLLNSFNNHINLPDAEGRIWGGSYYSFDYNGTHFVVLNTNDESDEQKGQKKEVISDEQMDWLRKDLAANQDAEWLIVSMHKPIFSGSYHSIQDSDVQNSREELIKVLTDYKVDLLITGHDHVNSRTDALVYDPEATAKNGRIGNAKSVAEPVFVTDNGVEVAVYAAPKGTVNVTVNTSGRKTYDALYNKGLDHLALVRPKLAKALGAELDDDNKIVGNRKLAEENYNYFKSLFNYMSQTSKSPRYKESHENYREGTTQNFYTYKVTEDYIEGTLWQVDGVLNTASRTDAYIVNKYRIYKDADKAKAYIGSVQKTGQKDPSGSVVKAASKVKAGQKADPKADKVKELPQTGAAGSHILIGLGLILSGLAVSDKKHRK